MSCSGLNLLSLDQALAHYAEVKTLSSVSLPLIEAHQQILAETVLSPVSLPLFTQSAVDGYALRSQDIAAGRTEFELIGEIRAGIEEHLEIHAGQAVRIFTGGKLPASADTVARQEIITRTADHITLNESLAVGSDIRYQGEELQQGTVLAQPGQVLHSGLIAALSMAGVKQVSVSRQPSIAVLITGDEVSSQLDNDAKVFDANAPMIITWLKEQGYDTQDPAQVMLQHVIDDEPILRAALQHAMQHYDLVITTGGVSVGDYDLIRPVSMGLGAQEIFWKVAQKPGKPLYFAHYQQDAQHDQDQAHSNSHNHSHSSYLLGLPGNPAAVLVCLAVHVSTLMRALQGISDPNPQWQKALFNEDVKIDSREQLLRMRLSSDEQGQMRVAKLGKQQSHMLSNLSQANVIVRIPAKSQLQAELKYVDFIRIE